MDRREESPSELVVGVALTAWPVVVLAVLAGRQVWETYTLLSAVLVGLTVFTVWSGGLWLWLWWTGDGE
jgi:hypothetical protein